MIHRKKISYRNERSHSETLRVFQTVHGFHKMDVNEPFQSSICRPTDILNFADWVTQPSQEKDFTILKNLLWHTKERSMLHRKYWEFIYIIRVLCERNMLRTGMKGLGFAVGTEPLASIFASYGCKVLCSDLSPDNESAKEWAKSNQHANQLNDLYLPNICTKENFQNNVQFMYLDMNHIPDDLKNFDFCWSACAYEHLGSLEYGKQFIYNMLKTLKPGGIAVHTTEINLSSNTDTFISNNCSIFRQCDFEEMYNILTREGHQVSPLDFRLDGCPVDSIISYPPYDALNSVMPHFKILIDSYISTSFGMIIKKKE
ncbi:MAG: class I SAM-dependent methyltransferase [Prevotellaceae bacterium]|nr:class I SAM-dependent methyltransferase [Prevotellaceae bacterium]